MKKFVRFIVSSFLILSIINISFVPIDAIALESKATTIKGLKEELEELKRQRNNNIANKNQTQSSINQKKQAIYNAIDQKNQCEKDIEAATNRITESEAEIERVSEEIKKVLVFNQLTSNNNMYVEYITNSTSLNDLGRRIKAVELITEYSHNQIDYLSDLIEENKQLKITLANKTEELQQAIVNYNNAIVQLDNYMSELEDVGDDINAQIKNQEALIKYYQSICSSDTQLLSDCVKVLASSGFVRPVQKGVVSSPFGNRVNPLNGKTTSFHYGIDIAGNSMGTPVYAAANGMVAAVTVRSSCGGNIVYIHHNVNGVAYTSQYAHLLSVNVKVGDTVRSDQVIGTVGGAGSTLKSNGGWDTCSTGAHLHFAIAKGHYLGGGANGYSSFSKFKSNMINPGNIFPARGVWFYKRY